MYGHRTNGRPSLTEYKKKLSDPQYDEKEAAAILAQVMVQYYDHWKSDLSAHQLYDDLPTNLTYTKGLGVLCVVNFCYDPFEAVHDEASFLNIDILRQTMFPRQMQGSRFNKTAHLIALCTTLSAAAHAKQEAEEVMEDVP